MLVACRSNNCRPCGSNDKTSDTVKVDVTSIHDAEKENLMPQQKSQEELELERQQVAQAEMEQRRQEQLRLQQLEEQRRAAEAIEQKRKQMQMQAEAEERERQRVAEAKRAAEVADMQRRQTEEARREREAQERMEEEARRARKERLDAEKVTAFLKAKGFSGVTVGRRKMLKTSYPLHVAVADRDAEMVELLLQAGADAAQKNSSGATPEQQALKLNKNGSHEAVLAKFRRPE